MNFKTLLASVAATTTLAAQTAAAADSRPNIVLFMVDDMGWQDTSLPFYKERTPLNDRFRTPNMERLAAMGMKFTRAYACAISSPSRCSLMTGMNQARHRVTNWTFHRDKPTDDPTLNGVTLPDWNYNGIQPVDSINNATYCTPLPSLLRDNGYHTIHVGKAHFGALTTPSADPLKMGFEVNIGGTAAGGPADGAYLGENRYGHDADGKPISPYAVPNLEKYWDSDVFLTEALTREALNAVETARATDDKPFYLYLSHYAVHVPFRTDSRFADNYPALDGTERMYATLIEGMDKSLGDVIDFLERTGEIDNTIIIFMSDNGGLDFYARGEGPEGTANHHNFPLRSGKGSLYEGGVREPMIVAWPGVTRPGSVCNDYVIIEDFFPSILEMAQIGEYETVQKVDGVSFVPLLNGSGNPSDGRALYWNTPQNWTNMISDDQKRDLGIGQNCSVVRGDWKLIHWYEDGKQELYNLSEDIAETTDLSATHPDLVKELASELGVFLRSADAQRPTLKATGLPCPWPDEK